MLSNLDGAKFDATLTALRDAAEQLEEMVMDADDVGVVEASFAAATVAMIQAAADHIQETFGNWLPKAPAPPEQLTLDGE